MEKRYRIKLNSAEKVEELLQEIYDDAVRQQNLIQDKINELETSTNLSEEPIDMKVKYAKAIHDYVTDKEKAIGRKLDVSKLMSEILKSNGDVEKVISDQEVIGKLDDNFKKIRDEILNGSQTDNTGNAPTEEKYITNQPINHKNARRSITPN